MFLAGLAIGVALWGGYWLLQRTGQETCRICRRPIHPDSRTVIEDSGGRREAVCCVRCGLFLALQQKSPVRLVEVTDYSSGRSLDPEKASYVEGSGVVMCDRHEPLFDETKHLYQRVFDRCTPSILAFAGPDEAADFASSHGGRVVRLAELLTEAPPAP
ncbi:MAG: hypothetical protein AB1640_17055 [bacterium]